jgi:hypothetical protein
MVYNDNMFTRKLVRFFDKLEDKTRNRLSHYPILYAFVGGTGVVLFWRGVWHLADEIDISSVISIIIGSITLLVTGIFVSAFVGNRLIISGLVGERKLEEKEKNEIETEETQIRNLQNTLNRLEKKLDHLDDDIEGK